MSEKLRLTPLQKAMSRHMLDSWEGVPQFSVQWALDCAPLAAFRQTLPLKVSYTTLIVRAAAIVLRRHPLMNASWDGDGILRHDAINIGVAADTKRGLLVPVIRDVPGKSLAQLHEIMEDYKRRSVRGNFTADQLADGTFTVSNLGMIGVEAFTAVVNHPQSAILALGALTEEPVVRKGAVVCGKRMKMTLSVDHRVTDGAGAARFLADLADVLQSPETHM